MLKLLIPSFTIMFYNKNMLMSIMFTSAILFMIMMKFTSAQLFIPNNFMLMDKLSLILMMLTLMSVLLIMISSNNFKEISMMIILIFMILMLIFSINKMILFYILFELVLIPTAMLIMKSGKQPERLQASIYLMMYTITASLPLLINIILMKNNQSFTISMINMLNFNMTLMFMLAFLVKMPMFMTHLWLPKAHVEAPLEGSMILAAILLKLGGYGLIRFMPMLITKMNKTNYWIISISMIGATATSLNCIRQKDLKSLIAYSSVAHMAFVLLGLFSMKYIGLLGMIMMMIAHGLSSSALFLLVNDLYLKYHTRNTLSFKGLISMSPNITFWWFIFMAINISAPPTINTFSEILIMSSMIMWNKSSMMMIFLISLSVTTFSMMMFVNLSHNKNEMLMTNQTHHKIYMSLFMHMIPTIMMLMKMETMLM